MRAPGPLLASELTEALALRDASLENARARIEERVRTEPRGEGERDPRRPVVEVYPGEANAFREAVADILAGAPAGYVPPPELDPILEVYDNPPLPPELENLAPGGARESDLFEGAASTPERIDSRAPSDKPVYDIVPGIPMPEFLDPPLDEEEPTGEVRTQPVGRPGWIGGVAEAPWEEQSDLSETESNEEPMADLSDIFGAIGDRIVGSLDFDPRTPGIFGSDTSLPDIVGGFVGPGLTPPATQPPRSTPVQVNIDPRTGAVTRCQPRRRRRRLLTKSDVADISTMAALLGKNSESFKVWLAKATR